MSNNTLHEYMTTHSAFTVHFHSQFCPCKPGRNLNPSSEAPPPTHNKNMGVEWRSNITEAVSRVIVYCALCCALFIGSVWQRD